MRTYYKRVLVFVADDASCSAANVVEDSGTLSNDDVEPESAGPTTIMASSCPGEPAHLYLRVCRNSSQFKAWRGSRP